MRYLSYAVLLIVGYVLQSTLFELITILDIKPDLILIIIVSIALLRGETEGAVMGFFGGLLMDTFAHFIGINTFIGMITGFLAGLLTKGFYKENPFVPVTAVFISTFFYNFAFYVLNILLEGYTQFGYFFNTIILREMVYNALITLPVYGIIYFINSLLEDKEHYKRKLF